MKPRNDFRIYKTAELESAFTELINTEKSNAIIGAIYPAHNVLGIFAECSLSVAMSRASREHLGNMLKQNIF